MNEHAHTLIVYDPEAIDTEKWQRDICAWRRRHLGALIPFEPCCKSWQQTVYTWHYASVVRELQNVISSRDVAKFVMSWIPYQPCDGNPYCCELVEANDVHCLYHPIAPTSACEYLMRYIHAIRNWVENAGTRNLSSSLSSLVLSYLEPDVCVHDHCYAIVYDGASRCPVHKREHERKRHLFAYDFHGTVLGPDTLRVLSSNYNTLRLMQGLAGLAFA